MQSFFFSLLLKSVFAVNSQEVMLQCFLPGSPFDDRAIIADEDNRMDVILNEVNSRSRNH